MKITSILSVLLFGCLALQACNPGSPTLAPDQATVNALQIQLAVEQTRNAEYKSTQAYISQQEQNPSPTPIPNTPTSTATPEPATDTPTPENTATSVPPTPTETPTITTSPTNPPISEVNVTVVNDYGKTAWLAMAGRVLTLNKSVVTKSFVVSSGPYYVRWACWTSWTTDNIEGSTNITVSDDIKFTITKNCKLTIR